MDLCTFHLADRLFGIDLLAVKEAVEHARVADVPHAPEEVAGLVNIRGQIHAILDLRRLLGFEPGASREEACLLLFKPAVHESLGIRLDSLGDVVSVDPASIEDRRGAESKEATARPDERRRGRHDLCLGVARTKAGLLVVLDPKAFAQPPRN